MPRRMQDRAMEHPEDEYGIKLELISQSSEIARINGRGSDEIVDKYDEHSNARDDLRRSRVSSDTHLEKQSYTVAETQTVIRKLNRHVVLFISGLYLLSFVDRGNIGNARLAGLESDLHLTSDQYDWLLTIFYITYIGFEWMTLLFRLIPPHIYLSVVVMAWGLLASAQALTTSFHPLLFLRFLLGISEAAFCGVPFYLSFFFKRKELAEKIGYFIAAAPLATMFASSLAWLITWVGQRTGIEQYVAPWRLLFLVEGFPSCLVAVLVWYHLPDGPESAEFLTTREKEIAVLRLHEDHRTSEHRATSKGGRLNDGAHRINVKDILTTLRDPKSYLTAFMFFSLNIAFSSTPVFLPTILNSMGYNALVSQILTAPPYFLSFISILVTSRLSDRSATRSPYLIFHSVLATSGYLFIFLSGLLGLPNGVRYLGVYPVCVGFFSCVTLIITWTLNNQASDSGKGMGVTILQMIGQCGPLVGTRMFPKSDGPLYAKGMIVCAVAMAMVGVLALVLRMVLMRENARNLKRARAESSAQERLIEGKGGAENAVFLYIL